MGKDVYANGNAIACKAGDGKVIAAFPDVCNSPPSPPAGPLPLPYPNSSFSKDLKEGSSSVKIGGKPAGLKDKSYFKSSPLGDEAATRTFGGSLVTHTITGKTYFGAWSMDVKFEGKNVCRHFDITTSNHSSYPGSTPPFTEMEDMALDALSKDQCPCCWQSDCKAALSKDVPKKSGTPRVAYSFREWYRLDEKDSSGNPTADAAQRTEQLAALKCEGEKCPNAGKTERKADAPCDVYRVTTKDERDEIEDGISDDRKRELRKKYKVPASATELAKEVFNTPFVTKDDLYKAGWTNRQVTKALQIDHRTPRAAGGCPTSEGNTTANFRLCAECKKADTLLDEWGNEELKARRAALGVK